MKRITITSIIALLAIWLAACSSLGNRNGSPPTGASNATPSPTPGAQDAKQQITDRQVVKQTSPSIKTSSARGAKGSVKYAKAKDAKRSMVSRTRGVKQQIDYVELQIIETQDVEQLVQDVSQPAEDIEMQPVEVIRQSVRPTVIVDTIEITVRPQVRRIYLTTPEYPECSTVYDTGREIYVH